MQRCDNIREQKLLVTGSVKKYRRVLNNSRALVNPVLRHDSVITPVTLTGSCRHIKLTSWLRRHPSADTLPHRTNTSLSILHAARTRSEGLREAFCDAHEFITDFRYLASFRGRLK